MVQHGSVLLRRLAGRRGVALLALALCALVVTALPATAAGTRTSQYEVTIEGPAESPLVNVPFEITGVVTPATAGATVRLQQYIGGAFKTVATADLDAQSGYTFTQVFDQVGGYTYQVVKPAGKGVRQGVSPLKRVFVTGDTLLSGRIMRAGNSLISSAGSFRLTMRPNGNLEMTLTSTSRAIWSSRTGGHPGAWAVLQRDGDLVVHAADGSVLMDTGTGSKTLGTYSVVMQEDSNLVIYTPGGDSLWSSDTVNPLLGSTETLQPGQYLTSSDRRYQLVMGTDGDLVVYNTKTASNIWASNTTVIGSYVVMQDDGDLIVRGPLGKPLWSSRTRGHPGAIGTMQPDGNFVVSSSGVPIWGTDGVNGVLGDDYPTDLRSAPKDSIIDPWRFYNRECVSFVAWRLNNANHMDFSNFMDGGQFGNANNWDNNARALGYTVDSVPVRGAVAESDSQGGTGHVAWVAAVGNGTVTIEDYNYSAPGMYGVRTVPTSTYVYIHLKDL